MKIRPVRAELFCADRERDRQTDRHEEANSRFSKLLERPYKLNREPAPSMLARGWDASQKRRTFSVLDIETD